MKLSDFDSSQMELTTDTLTIPERCNPGGSIVHVEVWYDKNNSKVYQLNRTSGEYREADASKVSSYGEWKKVH